MASTLPANLNPLDFNFWCHLKIPVYAAPVDKEEALRHRSVDACQGMNSVYGISLLQKL
jgi:hypothetical protein